MTGKKTCYSILILFTLFSCVEKKQNNEYTINGKVNGYQNDYIYLKIDNSVDSVLVKDSTFVFKGAVTEPRNASLYPENPNSKAPMGYSGFIIENNPISIHLTFDNFEYKGWILPKLTMDSIKGSTNQKILEDFDLRMKNTFDKEKNNGVREKILFENLTELIENNPKSFVSGEQLASKANFYGYLSSSQLETLYRKLDTSYQNKDDLKYITNIIERRKILDIGKIPPKIILPDEEGELVDSSTLKGKFLLLEFWASWCGPCRKTNPELRKLYNSYTRKDFEILGVSQDEKLSDWKTAIKKDSLKWIHVIDSLNTIGKEYKLTTIPFNVLLDKERRVIARDLKPSKLKDVLESKLNKNTL